MGLSALSSGHFYDMHVEGSALLGCQRLSHLNHVVGMLLQDSPFEVEYFPDLLVDRPGIRFVLGGQYRQFGLGESHPVLEGRLDLGKVRVQPIDCSDLVFGQGLLPGRAQKV